MFLIPFVDGSRCFPDINSIPWDFLIVLIIIVVQVVLVSSHAGGSLLDLYTQQKIRGHGTALAGTTRIYSHGRLVGCG